uniref:Uncharacterized protein n=1 Tax=Cyprinus carpio TaxID=7962 RepID=A0A8C1MF25_CYPCA
EFKKTIKLIVLCVLIIGITDYFNVFLPTAWDCEVIPGTLKQIDAGLGMVGGHFTVGPAGELGANSSKNIFRFADGMCKVYIALHLDIWLVLKYYSCGPYSCWGVNAAGNIAIRRVRSGVFEAVARALSMVEVDADGSVFAETIILWYFRVGVTISNPPGSSWTNIVICLNGHKHVTFDLGRLYVICSDGSIMRCI